MSRLAATAVACALLLACRSGPPPAPARAAGESQARERAPAPPEPPEPPAAIVPDAPRSAAPLPLTLVTSVEGQPAQAKTSGQRTEGTVADVAFLPPDGRFVVTVGNDDRARIVDTDGGATRWKSPSLRKDAEQVAVCGVRFWVETYAGSLFGFEWVDDPAPRVIPRGRAELGHGHMRGCYGEQGFVVHASLDDNLVVFDTLLGQVHATLRGAADASLTSRVNRHGWIAITGRPHPVLRNLAGGDEVELPLPWRGELGRLMQAHVVGDDHILTEHCEKDVCTVTLHDFDGTPRLRHRLRAAGSVWDASVPSTLVASANAKHFLWYRDGLPLTVVEVETGRRGTLPAIERTMSAVVHARFSPFDATLLAVTMTPGPNQVSLYRVGP